MNPFKSTVFAPEAKLLLLLLFLGLLYVGNSWSPSSYGKALELFQVRETGLVLGKARGIRSDEWAVMTPLIQATVNNGLRRFNETSYYREDLRMCYSLPLRDWGMLFKPTQWLYLTGKPVLAFSFHHFAVIFLFVYGYFLLVSRLGAGPPESLLFAVILFFNGFTQYWWTILGPVLAFFPWVFLAAQIENGIVRWPLLYWLGTCWILSFFYPPMIIPLGFLAAVLLAAYRPALLRLRSLCGLLTASIAAVATACFYLRDYLIANWNTVYPGQRRVGGGEVSFEKWVSQFLPTSQINHHHSLIGANICEIGVVGSLYLLLVLCFLRYEWLVAGRLERAEWRRFAILGGGLAIYYAWMFLPLPPWAGAILLWNRVPPGRLAYAAGFLLLLIALELVRSCGLRFTGRRLAFFAALLIGGTVYYKSFRSGIPFGRTWKDLVVLLPVCALFPFRWSLDVIGLNRSFLGIGAAAGVLAFGLFNPIQSARPIFNRETTVVTQMLAAEAARSQDGTLAVSGFPGAILNGFGFRSVTHVLAAPQLALWQKLYPAMTEQERNEIFNRYAHMNLADVPTPILMQADVIAIPLQSFQGGNSDRSVELGYAGLVADRGGSIDQVDYLPDRVEIHGWAPWKGESTGQKLHLVTAWPVRKTVLRTVLRPDVALHFGDGGYYRSGFAIDVFLSGPITGKEAFSLISTDSKTSSAVLLAGPTGDKHGS